MSVTCPCCRAATESGPACRRCKADLGLLFALEQQRRRAIESSKQRAVSAAIHGDFAAALAHYQHTFGERGTSAS